MTALLSSMFPSLETADLLQDGEAASRSLAAITKVTVAVATSRDNALGGRTSLDLGKGILQTGQRVFTVFVPLSLVLQSC